jgi:hypothetical protein
MKNTNYYKSLSTAQKSIIDEMLKGAILDCSEGSQYKAWLKYPDGTKKSINRISAEKITTESSFQYLSFSTYGWKIKNV